MKKAVAGDEDEAFPDAQAPAEQAPEEIEFVLQMTARTASPAFGSDQPTLNVVVAPAVTGSGLSVADEMDGGEFGIVTVNVPETPLEQAPEASQANA